MMRLSAFVNAIKAAYAGPEDWFIGAKYRFAKEGACDRIVVYPRDGEIGPPRVAAGSWQLSELSPNAPAQPDARDDIVMTRAVTCVFEVWAPNEDLAESRLCALLLAIDEITNVLPLMREEWPSESGAITLGGCAVNLICVLDMHVVTSDAQTVLSVDPSSPGEGVPLETVESVTINAYQDEELIATSITEAET